MSDLIKALSIFLKYADVTNPTHCEHDTLYIVGISKNEVSESDALRLDELGFFWNDSAECRISYRFGSA